MARPWAASVSEVLSAHAVSPSTGLSAAKVTALRAEYGPNELDKEEGTPLWKLVLQQFDDLLVKILLGGATTAQRLPLACLSAPEPAFAWLRARAPPRAPATA